MSAPRVASVGIGRMGRGIAHVFAYAGHPVALVDLKERPPGAFETAAAAAREEIAGDLRSLAALGLFDEGAIGHILARISVVPRAGAADALAGASFVFEGVPEVMEAKRDALAFIGAAAAPDAVIASTTSTILVDTLSEFLLDAAPRFLNAHWLNPAYLVPVVELSPGKKTDPAITARLRQLLEGIGKVPVQCAPSPGYIVPRIQALAMNEAARMVEEGVASAEDIDRAVRYGFGFRFAILGLLEFIDWGGGDILYHASRYLTGALGTSRFEAPPIIHENMEKGRTGMGAGAGFYDFASMDVPAYRRQKLAEFMGLLRHFGLSKPPVLG